MSKKTEKDEDKNPQVIELEKELAKKQRVVDGLTANNTSQAKKLAEAGNTIKETRQTIDDWAKELEIEKDWPNNLHIADILEKHIFCTLQSHIADLKAELKTETQWHQVYKAQSDDQDAKIKKMTEDSICDDCNCVYCEADRWLPEGAVVTKCSYFTPSGDGKGDGRYPQVVGDAEPGHDTGCDDPAPETPEGVTEWKTCAECHAETPELPDIPCHDKCEKLRAEAKEKLDNLRGCNQQLQEKLDAWNKRIIESEEKLKGKDVKIGHLAEEITGLTEIVKQNYNRATEAEAKLAVAEKARIEWRDASVAHWKRIIASLEEKLAGNEKHHELEHKIISDLEAKLEKEKNGTCKTCNIREEKDRHIDELEAKNFQQEGMLASRWEIVQQLEAGIDAYCNVECPRSRCIRCGLFKLRPSGVGNDPKCTCSTCAHELGPSREDKEACKACGPAVVNHGTHPLWKSKEKAHVVITPTPESSEGNNWINNPHPEITTLWNRCIKAEEELVVAQKSAARRMEVINEKNEDITKLEEQVKQLKYKKEQLEQLLGTADAQVKRMRSCMNCWYGNEEVCHIKDFKDCNYKHWKLSGVQGFHKVNHPKTEAPKGAMKQGDLVEVKDGGKSVYYRIMEVTAGLSFKYEPSAPTKCKYRTPDCQIDDCTDCDKQKESKEAKE